MVLTIIERRRVRGSGDLCGRRTVKSDLNADVTRYRMSKHMWQLRRLHDDVKQRGLKALPGKSLSGLFFFFLEVLTKEIKSVWARTFQPSQKKKQKKHAEFSLQPTSLDLHLYMLQVTDAAGMMSGMLPTIDCYFMCFDQTYKCCKSLMSIQSTCSFFSTNELFTLSDQSGRSWTFSGFLWVHLAHIGWILESSICLNTIPSKVLSFRLTVSRSLCLQSLWPFSKWH